MIVFLQPVIHNGKLYARGESADLPPVIEAEMVGAKYATPVNASPAPLKKWKAVRQPRETR